MTPRYSTYTNMSGQSMMDTSQPGMMTGGQYGGPQGHQSQVYPNSQQGMGQMNISGQQQSSYVNSQQPFSQNSRYNKSQVNSSNLKFFHVLGFS